MKDAISVNRNGELVLANRLDGPPAVIEQPPVRVGRLIFLLLLVCGLFWGGIGSWAAIAPLQSAVVAVGSLEVEGDLPSVQHLEGGLVREVLVREGDRVEEGQVLVVLADTVSTAQDRILLNQLVGALAQDQRLTAELRDAEEFVPSDELSRLIRDNPAFLDVIEAQRDTFVTNNEMWRGQAAILEDRLEDLRTQFAGVETRHATLKRRLEIAQTEMADVEQLYTAGLITKGRYLNQQESEISLIGDVSVAENQLASVQQRMAEIEERILQVRRDRASRLSSQRQAVKELIFDIRQRIIANQDVKDRSLIRASASGRVIGLKVNAAGEVVTEGEEIMKIVPEGATYIVQGQVRPQDVDQVQEGDTARVRLTAYNFRTTPPVEGTVVYLSADSFTDERTGVPYFRADVRLSEEEIAGLPDIEIQPGMPAQIMIATGEHTFANYILGPILAGLDTALREGD